MPTGMSPRRLLNVATLLALVVVLVIVILPYAQQLFQQPFSGQNVYLDLGSQIEALDAQTGRLHWTITHAHQLLATSDDLLIGVDLGDIGISAWNAHDGSLHWHTVIDDISGCSPAQLLTMAGTIALACAVPSVTPLPAVSATVVVLDAATGALLWHYNSGQATSLLLAAAGSDLLVGEANSNNLLNMWLYAFDARSGVAQWRMQVKNNVDEIDYDPVSNIVVARSGETLYGTSLTEDGTTYWQHSYNQLPPPLMAPHAIYVTTFSAAQTPGTVTLAVDPLTGSVRWQAQTPFPQTNSTATMPQGFAYINDLADAVVLLDAHTGKPRWQRTVGASFEPLAINGTTPTNLIVQSDTALLAVSISDGTLAWRVPLPSENRITRMVALSPHGDLAVVVANHDVYAVATQDGTLRWHVNLPRAPTLPPLVGS